MLLFLFKARRLQHGIDLCDYNSTRYTVHSLTVAESPVCFANAT